MKNVAASAIGSWQTSGSVRDGCSAKSACVVVSRTAQRLRVEPAALAVGAADDVHVRFELVDQRLGLGGAVLFEQLGDDAVERAAVLLRVLAGPPGERDVLVARAPQPDAALVLGELVPGRFEQVVVAEVELAVHRLGDAGVDVPLPAAEICPRADELDGARGERLRRIGHELRGVEAEHVAQAVARRAHALRAVEAEQLRRRRLEAEAAGVAGVVGAERDVAGDWPVRSVRRLPARVWRARRRLRRRRRRRRRRAPLAASRLTIGDGAASSSSSATMRLPSPSLRPSSTASASRVRIVGAGDEAVDHHFDVVPHLAVERQVVGELHDAAVDAGADEALLQQVLEQVLELALLPADDRARAPRTSSSPAAPRCGR